MKAKIPLVISDPFLKHSFERFIGSTVSFGVSDPWEFYEEHGDQNYSAIVKAASGKLLLLELMVPIHHKGTVCKYFVAAARHADKSLADMTTSHAVPVNLTPAIIHNEADTNADNLFKVAAS